MDTVPYPPYCGVCLVVHRKQCVEPKPVVSGPAELCTGLLVQNYNFRYNFLIIGTRVCEEEDLNSSFGGGALQCLHKTATF